MSNTTVYNNTQNGQTESAVSILGGQNVEVTTSAPTPPTVTLNASLVLGSLDITADSGATAIVNVVLAAGGTLSLNADGGIIKAGSLVGALTGTAVTIANGGEFEASSTFLSLLNSSSITFAADIGSVDTLQISNGGALLNYSETLPLAGYQTGGQDVVDDNLIADASVASYSITQAGQSQPDVVTYYNASSQSLGSLSFAAGTFNPGELGSYAVSHVGGPLQLTLASDGGVETSTNGNVLDGGSQSAAVGVGAWVTFNSTGGSWDTVTGSQGNVYVTNAQGSIVGGGDAIYFDNSLNDAVSLYSTSGAADTVNGSNGLVILNSSQANVVGGNDFVYGYGASSVTLSQTAGNWDAVYGSGQTVTVNSAQATVVGAGDIIGVNAGSSLSLYSTNEDFDAITGSDAFVTFNNAQASVTGGTDVLYINATGSTANLYQTAGNWDLIYGSSDTFTLNGAQASVVGGSNAITLNDASSVSLYQTNGAADTVTGSGDYVVLTNSQATIVGDANSIFVNYTNSLALSGTAEAIYTSGQFGTDQISGFVASDGIQFSTADFADFAAVQGAMTQSGANTVITLDVNDKITLNNVQASSLTSNNFSFFNPHVG